MQPMVALYHLHKCYPYILFSELSNLDFGALNGLEYETLGLGLSIRRMEIEVSSFNTVRGQEYDSFFSRHCELVNSS